VDQFERQDIAAGKTGQEIGIRVGGKVREGDAVSAVK